MDSFGAFTQCMVDADPESLRRDRKNRRFGLAISLTFQTGLLAVLVLIPLMSQAVLPMMRVNQIPLLQVPPLIRPMPDPGPHVISDGHSITYAPRNVAPLTHHDSSRQIGPEVSLGPVAGNAIGENIDILGAPSLPKPPEIPAPPQPAHPITRGGTVMEALLVNRVEPKYPAVAKAARMSGDVILNAIIGTDGTIQSLNVVSGNPLLIRAATDAVTQWRYKPTLLNGQPVEVETLITVRFVLQ